MSHGKAERRADSLRRVDLQRPNDNTGQQYSSSLAISSNATSFGSVQNNGATLTVARQLAVGGTGFGAFSQTAGSTTVGGFVAVGGNANGGIVNLNGGNFTMTGNSITIGFAASSPGVLNVSGNANMTMGTVANGFGLGIWVGEVGNGILNVSGNANITVPADSVTIANGTTNAGNRATNGIVNLNGGTVTANTVTASTGSQASTAAPLNFNGGTLKANIDSAAFIQNATTGSGTFNVFVYGGGATIDDGGHNITISQALKPPTGSGVSNTGSSSVSGSRLHRHPDRHRQRRRVRQRGATAVASIDGSGNLTGITITNPGTDYTSCFLLHPYRRRRNCERLGRWIGSPGYEHLWRAEKERHRHHHALRGEHLHGRHQHQRGYASDRGHRLDCQQRRQRRRQLHPHCPRRRQHLLHPGSHQ